jgi:hypothetical protein
MKEQQQKNVQWGNKEKEEIIREESVLQQIIRERVESEYAAMVESLLS